MPKIKTRKTIKKRVVGLTATSLLRLRKQSNQHRARFKSKRSLQQSAHTHTSTRTISKKIKRLVG